MIDAMARFNPPVSPRDPLQSPCIRSCCLDDQDICLGCGRSLDEIRNWSGLDIAQRRRVLELAQQRKAQHKYPHLF
jgi:predicted Fe-S protein YdhL (DUF1289 family)